MPTLMACAERLEVRGATVREDPTPVLDGAGARPASTCGEVTDKLLRDGIDAFVTPMEKLLAGIEAKREAIFTGRPETIDASLPFELEAPVAELVQRAEIEQVARRIWKKDPTLWGPRDQPEVADRLGWLQAPETYAEEIDDLEAFAAELASEGYTDAVLLGMGGSSLAPEVLRLSFGERQHGRLRLQVLDSTDPGAIIAVEASLALDHTIFIVSTKSGGTIETMSLYEHFWAACPNPEQYVAITDPGSSLAMLASERGFRRTFLNDPDVGGRYSALTFFGLVPAALMGVDLQRLLDGAGVAAEACAGYHPPERNSGLWLGAAMGALALNGRDKLTFVVDDPIASFGIWAEQLVAESTGKQGKGVLPVADEPVGAAGVYGEDRIFDYMRDTESPSEELDEAIKALADADEPTVTLSAGGPEDLGRIFFFAEFATAVAGWALGINPFDQPNVQEAKDATARVLDSIGEGGALHEPEDADDDALRALLCCEPPAYVAILAFVTPSAEVDACGVGAARGDPRRDEGDDDVRLRPALPALDGPVPQGRPEDRALPRARRRRPRRPRDPQPPVHVQDAEERPGLRRPRDPARPRPARREAAPRRRRRSRRDPRADRARQGAAGRRLTARSSARGVDGVGEAAGGGLLGSRHPDRRRSSAEAHANALLTALAEALALVVADQLRLAQVLYAEAMLACAPAHAVKPAVVEDEHAIVQAVEAFHSRRLSGPAAGGVSGR